MGTHTGGKKRWLSLLAAGALAAALSGCAETSDDSAGGDRDNQPAPLADVPSDASSPASKGDTASAAPKASPKPKAKVKPKAAPKPKPKPRPKPKPAPKTDPLFDTCGEANDNDYGNYVSGVDPEYNNYDDRDGDGTVCEF